VRARVSAKEPRKPSTGPDNSGAGLPGSRVQSVDRAVWLLRAVADAGTRGAATAALGQACGLNRATAWRILSTLESHDLVASDRRARSYAIFYTVGVSASASAPFAYGLVSDGLGIPVTLGIIAVVVCLTIPLAVILRTPLAALSASART